MESSSRHISGIHKYITYVTKKDKQPTTKKVKMFQMKIDYAGIITIVIVLSSITNRNSADNNNYCCRWMSELSQSHCLNTNM